MIDVLAESRKYFEARLKECQKTPHLHTEQVKTYNQYLSIVASSTSPEDYRQKLGPLASMFAIARAEQVDKYFNLMRLYHKLQIPDKLAAAKLRYDTAVAAKNHGDLVNMMSTAQSEAAKGEAKGYEKLGLAATLIQCVFAYMNESDGPEKNGILTGLLSTYTDLLRIDPTFQWQSYQTGPYSYVVCLDATRMQRLGEVFAKAKE